MSERFRAVSQKHGEEMQNLTAESELISKYKPTLIGVGNDHFVYSVENHPNSVIKINRESIRFALKYHLESHGSVDDYENDADLQEDIDNRIEYFKERKREFEEHFGKEHVPASRFVKMRIPVIPSFYEGISVDDETKIPEELLVVANVQERVMEDFTEEDSVHAWYIKDDPDTFAYVDYTTTALTEPHGLLARPKRPDLTEEGTRAAVLDFTQKAILYTKETGQIMDLNGVNNIILTHDQDGNVSYKLIDALFPAPNWKNVVSDVAKIIEKSKENPEEEVLRRDKIKVKLTANYIRFINELACAAGSNERLDQLASTDSQTQAALGRILLDIFTELKTKEKLTQK